MTLLRFFLHTRLILVPACQLVVLRCHRPFVILPHLSCFHRHALPLPSSPFSLHTATAVSCPTSCSTLSSTFTHIPMCTLGGLKSSALSTPLPACSSSLSARARPSLASARAPPRHFTAPPIFSPPHRRLLFDAGLEHSRCPPISHAHSPLGSTRAVAFFCFVDAVFCLPRFGLSCRSSCTLAHYPSSAHSRAPCLPPCPRPAMSRSPNPCSSR